ncbi:MAG TPA: DUF4190 domain-containing protein [Verrucomicrobiae bacterium]
MYKIVGADGRVYGPVSAEQIQKWIAEGRANAQTQTLAEGAAAWKQLNLLPEFAHYFAAQVPPIAPVSPSIPPLATAGARKINGWALAGLIFSGASVLLCCCPFLFSIPGLIFSLIGLSQISGNPHLYEGRGMAIVGLALSIIGIFLGIIVTLDSLLNGSFHYHLGTNHFP